MIHATRTGRIILTVAAALVFAASPAMAGTGIGGVFNLGVINRVNAVTTLKGTVAGAQLKVLNASTRSGATGLDIRVAKGRAPMTVNSRVQVTNLNAGMVGGVSASGLVRGHGSVTQSGLIILSPNSATGLGPVPGFGTMAAQCGDNAADVTMTTSNGIGPFLFSSPAESVASPGGSSTMQVLGETVGGNLAVAQISTGSRVATITATRLVAPPSFDCYFSVQVVYSHS